MCLVRTGDCDADMGGTMVVHHGHMCTASWTDLRWRRPARRRGVRLRQSFAREDEGNPTVQNTLLVWAPD